VKEVIRKEDGIYRTQYEDGVYTAEFMLPAEIS